MSAMDDMLSSMIKKMIPAEVAELLTKDKMEDLGKRITVFVEHINSEFICIRDEQAQQHAMLAAILANQRTDEERYNDRRDDSGGGPLTDDQQRTLIDIGNASHGG